MVTGGIDIERLRSEQHIRVGMISGQSDRDAASLAASLGVDFHLSGLTPDDRIHLLKDFRNRGFRVAYVGGSRLDPRIAAEGPNYDFMREVWKRQPQVILRRSSRASASALENRRALGHRILTPD